jgi:hypothetical protein
MFGAHSNSGHPRIAIGVGEINIPTDKDVRVIRAACGENERAQDRDLKTDQNDADQSLHKINNRKSAIENRK